MDSTSWHADAVLAASSAAFGIAGALSVVALRTLRPADLLAIELTGSALVLVAICAVTGRLHRSGSLRAMAQGAVTPGLGFLFADLGLARTSATAGTLLTGTETLVTVLLAVLVLRERIGRPAATALLLGLGGTVLVALGGSPAGAATTEHPFVGNLLVVASVTSGAAYVVWSRRTAQTSEDDGLGLTAWQFVGAAVAVSPFVAGSWLGGGSRIAQARPVELAAAAAVLVCGVLGLLLFNLAIGRITASRAGLLAGLQPVAGVLTALVLLGEPIGIGELAGGLLIVVGIVVLTRHAEGPPDRPAPVPASVSARPSDSATRGRCTT